VRRDPLIIGAGPAGTAAAIRLGQAGYRPILIERAVSATDKVCGDFLGADAIERLRALGVDPAALGAAPIHHLRVIHRSRMVETPLPFPALGLSRRVLDQALLCRAEVAGAALRMGQAVRRITAAPDHGWAVHTGPNEPILASGVFLATGKHDLRDLSRPGVEHGAIGMKMYYCLASRFAAALTGVTELILFPGGYAGLQYVEAGRAVLCVALRRREFQAVGGTWAGLLAAILDRCPHLAKMLAGATPLLPRPLAVAGVPYGLLHRPPVGHNGDMSDVGLFRLGDQAAVIPSLTGDGIAIALHSGALAARSWHLGEDAHAYHRRLASDLGGQMRLAGLLHRAAMLALFQSTTIRVADRFPALLRQAARGTRISKRASRAERR